MDRLFVGKYISRKVALSISIVALLILLLALPIYASRYIVSLVITILMYYILAQSWNLFSGLTGYISFGHIVFFGIGAYTTALLTIKLNIDLSLALILSAVIPMVFASLIGLVILRISGLYFAVLTLAISEITRNIVINLDWLTEGSKGIALYPVDTLYETYYMLVALGVMVTLIFYVVKRSRVGLALLSIKEDEVVAQSIGIDSFKYKLLAYTISAGPPGVVGGIMAQYWTYIEPHTAFSLAIMTAFIVMASLGGLGSLVGPIIGSSVLSIFFVEFPARFPGLDAILTGAILIAIVIFMPNGVVGLLSNLQAKRSSHRPR